MSKHWCESAGLPALPAETSVLKWKLWDDDAACRLRWSCFFRTDVTVSAPKSFSASRTDAWCFAPCCLWPQVKLWESFCLSSKRSICLWLWKQQAGRTIWSTSPPGTADKPQSCWQTSQRVASAAAAATARMPSSASAPKTRWESHRVENMTPSLTEQPLES